MNATIGVTLTVDALAAAMRLGDGTTPLDEPLAGIVTNLLAAGTRVIHDYAPTAPSELANEACVRYCAYLYDGDVTSSGERTGRRSNPLHNSGAAALLRNYANLGAGLTV